MQDCEVEIILKSFIGLRVIGLVHNYSNRSVTVCFDQGKNLLFNDCQLVYDLGIIGNVIKDISSSAGLGMVLELRKLNIEPENYSYCTLSKGFENIVNKQEIRISFSSCVLTEDV